MRLSRFKMFVRMGKSFAFAVLLLGTVSAVQAAEPLVPGTGQKVVQVGDDFEDEKWEYYPATPKSSENIDEAQRIPGGVSKNGRFYEGIMRGQPDLVKRVKTPEGGLEGSTGSLLLRSMWTGIPGRPTYHMQQDDFIADVENRLGGSIPVSQNPSFTTRVYLPPVNTWERRTGAHFAVRAAVDTLTWKHEKGHYWGREVYYPGMFLEFNRKEDTGLAYDTAHIRVRADDNGADYKGPQITQTGWWNFGMSFTPDGKIHFYAKQGIEDFTKDDLIASHYSYGFKCLRFKTFFYNVCSADDGRTWSTPWIIDDPTLFYIRTPELAAKPGKPDAQPTR